MINALNEIFRASILMKSRWKEPNKISKYNPKKHWNPRLYIENGQTISTVDWLELAEYEIKQYPEYTEVTEIKNITGDFWERMELHDFPLSKKFGIFIIFLVYA